VIAFFLLHAGIMLTFRLGLFPWISCAALLIFIPGSFWDKLIAGPARGPAGPPLTLPRATHLIAAGLIACVLVFNLQSVERLRFKAPHLLKPPLRALALDQNWGMYKAPDGNATWFVFWGRLADGREINPYTGKGPVNWDPPALASDLFGRQHWSRYLHKVLGKYRWAARYFSAYQCRGWNESRADAHDRLTEVRVYAMMRGVQPDGGYTEPKKIMIERHYCEADPGPGIYLNEKKNGPWTEYYPGGAVWARGLYNEGVKDGEWTYWFPNGQIKSAGIYNRGLQTGYWQTWFPGGHVKSAGFAEAGRQTGEWAYWHPDGSFKTHRDF
jgi:hypothetical protein